MGLGRLETFLVIVVLAAAGWLGTSLYRGRSAEMCAPLSLSNEVKAYIDSKIAASAGGQCGEIPKMIATLSDLQSKIGGIEFYRVSKLQLDLKRKEMFTSAVELHKRAEAKLAEERLREVQRIKADIANICTGVTPGSEDQGIRPRRNRRGSRALEKKDGEESPAIATPPPSIPDSDSTDTKPGSGSEGI